MYNGGLHDLTKCDMYAYIFTTAKESIKSGQASAGTFMQSSKEFIKVSVIILYISIWKVFQDIWSRGRIFVSICFSDYIKKIIIGCL